jgi:hypothetical protein
MIRQRWADGLGMCMALACALHCAALTSIFLLYPGLWMKRKYWDMGLWQKLMWLEWSLLGLAWVLVVPAMLLGWRQHRRIGPGLLALFAIVLLTLLIATPLHFSGYWTSYAALATGLALAAAHYWNLRMSRRRV